MVSLLNSTLTFFYSDHVFAVHQAALRLLDTVLVDFIPRHELGKVEITQVIAQSLPALIQKTGETVSTVLQFFVAYLSSHHEKAMKALQ